MPGACVLSRARVVFASRAWTRSWRDVRRVDVLGGGGGGGGARRRCPATATATAMSTTTTTTTPPSARATSPAAKSTLTYVDTHCHLDLIFDRMNAERRAAAKKNATATASADADAGADADADADLIVDFASWRRDVARADETNATAFHGASFEACLTVACSRESFERALEAIATHDGVYASFGCHPLSATQWDDSMALATRRHLTSNERAVAIGECGLDYHYETDAGARETQKRVFVAQIEMAAELDAPIIVHTRDAEARSRLRRSRGRNFPRLFRSRRAATPRDSD